MRTSLVFFLLLWSQHLREAQGIRLDKGFIPTRNQQIQEEKSSTPIKTSSINGGAAAAAEVFVLCKGHCTGNNRKLSTTVTTINTNSKDGGNGANSLKPTLKGESGNLHEEVDENLKANSPDHQQHYVDITDINEMDYTPARRKPPIHN